MRDMNTSAPARLADETDAARQDRLASEAEGIASARASVAAGLCVTSTAVDAWIDSLSTDTPLPAPLPLQPRLR